MLELNLEMNILIVNLTSLVFFNQRMETHKFQKMVDRKFEEFVERFDDYFGMKMLENMMTTLDVILYLEFKPVEQCLPIEIEAKAALKEFKELHEDFNALIAVNKQRAVEFRTRLSRGI